MIPKGKRSGVDHSPKEIESSKPLYNPQEKKKGHVEALSEEPDQDIDEEEEQEEQPTVAFTETEEFWDMLESQQNPD